MRLGTLGSGHLLGLFVAHTCQGGLRSGNFLRLAVARVDSELLLKLKVSQTAHCLGRFLALRRFVQELPVVNHGLFQALFDLDFFDIRLHVTQLGQRP